MCQVYNYRSAWSGEKPTKSPVRYAQDIHRAPPHSVEAEMGVLGSMLVSPREAVAECVDKIDERYFFIPQHVTIYCALVELWKAGDAIDLITFTQHLRDANLLEGVGGAAFVTSLFTFVPTAANVGYYLDIVRDKFVLREVIAKSTEAVRRAYEEQDDPNGVLEDVLGNMIEIGHLAKWEETSRPLAAFVPDALKQIELTYRQRGKCTGISTGFPDLDRTMNGFEAPLTYYFAARPAMGKSSLMLGFAEHIAIRAAAEKRRVKIFSVEMTGQTLAKRLICSRANINLKNLRFGFLDKSATNRAKEASAELMTDYIRVDEKGDLSIFEFRARARHAVLKDGCQLIMVDYLQRMRGSSKRAQLSRELEINEIAQGISATAKELRVPIVVLAQLNRKPEERKDGKPELGDLRESGSIEQEARFVGLLWRPKYYATSTGKRTYMMDQIGIGDEEAFDQYAECIVAKQNEGPVGPIPLRFVEEYARYEPQDPDRPLFSNKPSARQRKAASGNGEITAEVAEIFPGASVMEGDL